MFYINFNTINLILFKLVYYYILLYIVNINLLYCKIYFQVLKNLNLLYIHFFYYNILLIIISYIYYYNSNIY